jgi:hypothetical protein
MAKPQSTAGTRARKNLRIDHSSGQLSARSKHASLECALPVPNGSEDAHACLEQAIEVERGRLSNAQSILGCLHAALLSAEERNRPEPGCADVVAIALKLIREAVHRLDYVHLRPLIDSLRRAGNGSRRRVQVTDAADQHGR